MSKLKQWGKSYHDHCPLCGYESETESHLFFLCTYSRLVWQAILYYLSYSRQIQSWAEELQWCVQTFRGNGTEVIIKKVALNATVYHIWAERNRRIHQQKYRNSVEVVRNIYEDIRIKFSLGQWNITDTAQNRTLIDRLRIDTTFSTLSPTLCYWQRPRSGWFKLNTDGSLRGEDSLNASKGGYGAIIRNDQGDVIAACSGDTTGHSVIKHELQGVLMGLKLARLHNIRKIEISTDSTNVLAYLSNNDPVPWDLKHVVWRIRYQLSILEDYACKHDYRETNRAADYLAGLYPNTMFVEFTPSSFAEDLKKIVYEDKTGKKYLRM